MVALDVERVVTCRFLDARMRDLTCSRLELDELWSFVQKKQRRVRDTDDPSRTGDVWTFIALDPESKLVPSFLCAKRDVASTRAFVFDLASRLRYRVQLSTSRTATCICAWACAVTRAS